METNNYTTNLRLVSQEYSDEKTSLQTKTKKLLEYFSPKDIWKIKGLIVACLVACFLYVTYLTHFSFAFPAIVVLISTIELGCRLLGGKAKECDLNRQYLWSLVYYKVYKLVFGVCMTTGGALRFFAFMRVSSFT